VRRSVRSAARRRRKVFPLPPESDSPVGTHFVGTSVRSEKVAMRFVSFSVVMAMLVSAALIAQSTPPTLNRLSPEDVSPGKGDLKLTVTANEIKTRSRRNVVKSRLFSELLEGSIRKYQNRAIQAAQVIEELIGLAKEMREETAKGEALGLSEDEVAFYDALKGFRCDTSKLTR